MFSSTDQKALLTASTPEAMIVSDDAKIEK